MNRVHTFSLLPLIRNSKNGALTEWALFLRVTVDGKRVEISTKQFIEPTQWNKKKGRVRGNSERARVINSTLETYENKARQHYQQLLAKGKWITAQMIKDAVLGKENRHHSLMNQFNKHVAEIGTRVSIDISKGTYQNYKATAKHLKAYLKHEFNTEDLFLNQLNHEFITGFEGYLKTVCLNQQNGTLKHIQRLRKVVTLAVKNDLLEKDPFGRFKTHKEKVNRDFLSGDELHAIEQKEISLERIRVVRDVFLFACYTGLSYKDVRKLTNDHIRRGIDGDWWIFTERSKTNVPSNVPLLSPALNILERYKNHPLTGDGKGLLPVYSNQKLNSYLKEIADICGISKNLTFHTARHTFATTVTLSNNIPIETVSKMLGHTSIRTTQIYAKVLEQKVSNDMRALKEKYNQAASATIRKKTMSE
jgi:integrase